MFFLFLMKGAAGSESLLHRTGSDSDRSRKHETQTGVVADLLDLQFELNSLQQGIHQMDKITPDNPRATEDPFEADPFGDSFANMKVNYLTLQYKKMLLLLFLFCNR